ncbi:MAG: NIPSNAP family protein [Prolixibacteraceae bacterium]|nr:NIPSNAP family protein [Prolixibacteraceae bacterium]MBN2773268.1 NIPSNAP family protein [Prolixibacteraceae bacterium]
MKRRSFIKGSAAIAATATVNPLVAGQTNSDIKNIYELREYHFSGSGGTGQLKSYLVEALIPFMNKKGIKVGAFGEYSLEEPPTQYLLFVYPDFKAFFEIRNETDTDKEYQQAAETYLKSDPSKPVFERYETYLMEAFEGIPQLKVPDKSRGLFEWRTYESYNEDAGKRKIEMFNKEELPLFEKVGLHPVFFGKILAGKKMPALSYLLWFKDMEERTTNWGKFTSSPEWNTMRNKTEYANTVSKVNKKFLIPLDYSQI